MNPLVSIIIPALQEEEYIEPLLESITDQTYEPIEVIISDQSPEDSKRITKGIAYNYGARVVDIPEKNTSLARNVGAEASSGDVLVFCDADCIMHPNHIDSLVGCIEIGYTLAISEKEFYDSPIKDFLYGIIRPFYPKTGCSPSVAISRQDFFDIGGYDAMCIPKYGCLEDKEFHNRVESYFGYGSVVRLKEVTIATSARRPLMERWEHRGYRDGQAIDRFMIKNIGGL